MKTSLFLLAALTVLATVPANAASPGPKAATGCSGGAWPIFSPTCRNVANYTTYGQCVTEGMKLGWRGNDLWWYCSSLGLKS